VKYCDLTLPTPAENLACDEALLDMAESGAAGDLLRVWDGGHYFVVVGYGKKANVEVDLPFCRLNTIPILRRCTGGGTVLQGPGCLNYTLVLRMAGSENLGSITATNNFILKRHQTALATLLKAPIEMRGHTDHAIGGLKFSGNAQRRKKDFLIFHGTFMLHLDISLIEKALPVPAKQPDYRLNRSHSDFLVNLKAPASRIKAALAKCWGATERLERIPFDRITTLVRDKYSRDDWNFRF